MCDRSYKNLFVENLLEYKANSRTHSDHQITQLVNSIKEFGFTNPILVDECYIIIAGHARLQAAKQLRLSEVPCIIINDLTDAQKQAYVIADNKLALNAGWDFDILRAEFEELKLVAFDLELTGFGIDELCEIFPDEEPEVFGDEDECPEAPADPVTKLGDVWLLGAYYQCDSCKKEYTYEDGSVLNECPC